MTSETTPLGRPIAQSQWPQPLRQPFVGTQVRLEPMRYCDVDALWDAVSAAPDSFTYLRYGPFDTKAQLAELIDDLSRREDQPFWTVFSPNGEAHGWASICDIYPNDGSIEIGSIWFAPSLQGTAMAREAIFLLMRLGMDDFGYERLVWRCQLQNQKSVQAALNLGFTAEGIWRNAAVVKGTQRDVAWFSILRREWPDRKQAFERWLDPANFDAHSKQIKRLKSFRAL